MWLLTSGIRAVTTFPKFFPKFFSTPYPAIDAMDPKLKEYLDAWSARHKREFDDIIACFDALHRSMEDTAGCFVGPVQASFDTANLVTSLVGLAEHPAPATTLTTSLESRPQFPSTPAVVPAPWSTDCVAQIILQVDTCFHPSSSPHAANGHCLRRPCARCQSNKR